MRHTWSLASILVWGEGRHRLLPPPLTCRCRSIFFTPSFLVYALLVYHCIDVSLQDVVSAILFILNKQQLKGPVNVCAPEPVTNAAFTAALGAELSRPTFLPVPEVAVKLLFGQMGDEMVSLG